MSERVTRRRASLQRNDRLIDVVDLADEFHTPYTYVGGNPVNLVDPDGAQSRYSLADFNVCSVYGPYKCSNSGSISLARDRLRARFQGGMLGASLVTAPYATGAGMLLDGAFGGSPQGVVGGGVRGGVGSLVFNALPGSYRLLGRTGSTLFNGGLSESIAGVGDRLVTSGRLGAFNDLRDDMVSGSIGSYASMRLNISVLNESSRRLLVGGLKKTGFVGQLTQSTVDSALDVDLSAPVMRDIKNSQVVVPDNTRTSQPAPNLDTDGSDVLN